MSTLREIMTSWGQRVTQEAGRVVLYYTDANNDSQPLLNNTSGGIPIVSRDGAGAQYGFPLKPVPIASANSANSQECQVDSSGFLSVVLSIYGLTAPNAQIVGLAWSYTVNDQVAVKAALDLLLNTSTGKVVTPDGVNLANTKILSLSDLSNAVGVIVDPATPIKTWMVALGGAAAITGLGVYADVTRTA